MLDGIVLEQGIVDRQDGTARIAEHRVDALVLQGFDDHFGAVHQSRHAVLRGLAVQDGKTAIKKAPGGALWSAPEADAETSLGPFRAPELR